MPAHRPDGHDPWTDVVFSRLMPASRQALFNAWTNEEEVAAWWGPHGFSNPVCSWDAAHCGNIYIDMTAADGMVFPLTGSFHEVRPPERVVFTSRAFENEEGLPQLEVLNTVIFTEEGGSTRLTMESTVMRASAEVKKSLRGMQEGWRQSLDKLEQYLAKKHGLHTT